MAQIEQEIASREHVGDANVFAKKGLLYGWDGSNWVTLAVDSDGKVELA